jgi:hypothetical protein
MKDDIYKDRMQTLNIELAEQQIETLKKQEEAFDAIAKVLPDILDYLYSCNGRVYKWQVDKK